MKKISIVIPVYNRRADLERCLESVRSVYTEYFETIAVDDGSTDGSYEFLVRANYPNLTVLRNPANKGVNYTRNRGIEKATGDYVLFLDSDDKLLDGALDVVIETVAAHEGIRHFLFYLTSNLGKKADKPYEVEYQQWLREHVYGDFTHVLVREVLLQYPFFEQFRAYENLNWMRILKETSPQLVIPKTITWVDQDRTDNLTKSLGLRTTAAIEGKFNYMDAYLGMYGADLYALDPAMYRKKFHHALLLGIAAHKKKETLKMIDAASVSFKAGYKSFVQLAPTGVLNKMIRSK
jgi:glycosyltransferase involved in cell wall biosynthesis